MSCVVHGVGSSSDPCPVCAMLRTFERGRDVERERPAARLPRAREGFPGHSMAQRLSLLLTLAADTDENGEPVEPIISREQLVALLDAPVWPRRLDDPTTDGDALGYVCMLARIDANGGEIDLIDKCEAYLRARLADPNGTEDT